MPPGESPDTDREEGNGAPAGGLFQRVTGATLNYGIGGALPQIIGFLLIPVYTAFLTPEDYGILEFAATLGPLLAVVMRFGVPGAVSRFYFDYRDGPALHDYVTTIHRFLIVNSILVAGLALVVLALKGDALLPGLPFLPFVVLVVIRAMATGNADLQRRLIQAREQSAYSAKLNVAFGLTGTAIALSMVVGLRWGALGLVAAQTITAVLFFFQAQHYLRADIRGRVRKKELSGSFKYALGILPSQIMGSFAPLVTRSALSAAGSMAAVGLFGLANRLAMPLTVLSTAFANAYLPVYFSVREEGTPDSLRRLVEAQRSVWSVAVLGALAVGLVGPPVILLVTPERFHGAAPLIPVLALAFVARTLYALLVPELYYSKKTGLVPIVAASSMVANIAVTLLMVDRFGAFGVAWGLVAGFAASAVAALVCSMRLVRLPHDWIGLARTAVVGALIFSVTTAFPVPGPWSSIGLAAVLLTAFPIAMWLMGDPTVRLALAWTREFLDGRSGSG